MRERSEASPGRVRFPFGDPQPAAPLVHRIAHYRRAAESGLSDTVPLGPAGSTPAPAANMAGLPARLLSVALWVRADSIGPNAVGYLTQW
jgi:hypothetical protein